MGKDAVENGAKIINRNGGKSDGRIFYPTILSPVNDSMRIYHEKQFGPLVPVVIFDEVQEVIDFWALSHNSQQESVLETTPRKLATLLTSLVTWLAVSILTANANLAGLSSVYR